VHWLIILILAVVLYRQDRRLKSLEARVAQLLNRAAPPVAVASPVPAALPVEDSIAPAFEPLAVQEPLAAASPWEAPASLDRPTPERQSPEPVLSVPTPAAEPLVKPLLPEKAPASTLSWPAISTWLAENGLAWIGGGGLALGGLLLVMYAAQRGVFTPPLRIAMAVLLGGGMIAASEWILRQKQVVGGRHLLAAAVAAGAGAVTLYGAVCAAHGLYHLIPLPVAAVLTATISFGLLGLALRHGEPLALLAIFGAALAPFVTGADTWSPAVLEAYLVLIGVTGSAISAVRHWGKAGHLTLAALVLWSAVLVMDRRALDAAVLLLIAVLGPFCGAAWRRARAAEPGVDKLFDNQPAVALGLVSLASMGVWLHAMGSGHDLPIAIVLASVLVVLGAAVVAAGLIPAMVFAAPVAVAALAALMVLAMNGREPETPWIFVLAGLIPAAGLLGALRIREAKARMLLLAIGGLGAAALASFAWPLLRDVGLEPAWLPAALISGAMFAAALLVARKAEASGVSAASDAGLGLWLAAAAEMAFLAIHAATPVAVEPAAQALAALALAVAAGRLAWRGLAPAAVAGGLMAFAVMLRPGFIGDALDGRLALTSMLGVAALASALLFAGSRLMRSRLMANRAEGEALSTASLLTLLLGVFTGLHIVLSGPHDASGPLFEASLRTLLLLSAGLLLVARQREDDGLIARWRTVAVIGLGVLHGLIGQGLVLNPWWGMGEAPAGLPVLNSLILSFLAPALLLAVTVRRRSRPQEDWSRGWLAAAVVFALLWIVLTLRHVFQGAAMSDAGIGRAEACAYAILGLLAARALLSDRVNAASQRIQWLRQAAPTGGWVALVAAALVFGRYASPWWGPLDQPLASIGAGLLLFGLYGLGAATALGLRRGETPFSKAALCLAVGILFVLMSLLIRWAFHGADLSSPGRGGALETWTFSALWAVFGLVVLSLGAARRDATLRWAGLAVLLMTAVKVMFFDLARLEGVVRAASFLAVGALFLVGALAARRLNARAAKGASEVSPAAAPGA